MKIVRRVTASASSTPTTRRAGRSRRRSRRAERLRRACRRRTEVERSCSRPGRSSARPGALVPDPLVERLDVCRLEHAGRTFDEAEESLSIAKIHCMMMRTAVPLSTSLALIASVSQWWRSSAISSPFFGTTQSLARWMCGCSRRSRLRFTSRPRLTARSCTSRRRRSLPPPPRTVRVSCVVARPSSRSPCRPATSRSQRSCARTSSQRRSRHSARRAVRRYSPPPCVILRNGLDHRSPTSRSRVFGQSS